MSPTEPVRRTSPRLMDQPTYREYITGMPPQAEYRVPVPGSEAEFAFHGILDGRLVHTIARSGFVFDELGEPREGYDVDAMFLQPARAQLSAAGDVPVLWCVQEKDGAAGIVDLFDAAGITGITVIHAP